MVKIRFYKTTSNRSPVEEFLQECLIRFFYFIEVGAAIDMIHALKKKRQDIAKEDIDLILRRLKEI
ncbi:MAG: hypothetical protein EB078_08810 [Proteobacteria bacterium]|nr:hypothetical protein [Pseudomonadota bacterium]NDD04993.1 hypothetical protein [Pseudomonadota bacterium]